MRTTRIYEDKYGCLSAIISEDDRIICAASRIVPDGTSVQWYAWTAAWRWLLHHDPDECADETQRWAAAIRSTDRLIAEAKLDWIAPNDIDDEVLIEKVVGRKSKILSPNDLVDVLKSDTAVNEDEEDIQKASLVYEDCFFCTMFITKCVDEKYLVLVRGEAGELKCPFVCGIGAKQLVRYLLITPVLKQIG